MKILVTGGSGYLGTHVRRFFSADDFSRRSNSDILNARDLDRVANYDVVIHLAAHMDKSPASAELCFQTNAEGTKNLIQSMRPNSVFIYASTKDVYGSHANGYPKEVPESCATSYAGQSSLNGQNDRRKIRRYYASRKVFALVSSVVQIMLAQPPATRTALSRTWNQ